MKPDPVTWANMTNEPMEKEYGLQAAYVILSMAIGIYLTMRPLTTYLLRRRLLELGQWTEQTHKQMEQERDAPSESLKWGLILLCSGIGLIIVHFLPVPPESSLNYGVIMVSSALGFLIYYRIVTTKTN
ncbi:DUF6249 domain-containing protein [Spirosoma sp.]|uniref:DUF6249 domain-containing protein n=2 Tax=unclassified Spirosoma TaxID=2621999 RepID=UPI001AC96ABB|nr:DUF6249 domain-containing protein [Spirosoma sp.]MBN8823728.1 hypothetical protein [Spirosoma sp.]